MSYRQNPTNPEKARKNISKEKPCQSAYSGSWKGANTADVREIFNSDDSMVPHALDKACFRRLRRSREIKSVSEIQSIYQTRIKTRDQIREYEPNSSQKWSTPAKQFQSCTNTRYGSPSRRADSMARTTVLQSGCTPISNMTNKLQSLRSAYKGKKIPINYLAVADTITNQQNIF